MKKNMGTFDRVLRIVVALIIITLYFTHILTGIWSIIFLIVAAIFVLTSLVGFCPLYLPLGISTCRQSK
ncbi:MAG: YgaP family membrane protein [Mucilaginibacter sp.]|uniref:YgaP family membrane protein n=1 Tax=Mucilaginibacter sp. L3T2-6 TaxID=3062491 RepID=UPI0026761687|nr:DUF2892 domain-containing protein [Mucilaginibacter sp. L3T2-6]MDO3643801.1 DUF2892 domain-containing protein [Mucilaginibacter sp. L3T2-6]MDV6216252.1 DUF2892 domain-containing protein [Mucilaginibacter sp. L3T2-6]